MACRKADAGRTELTSDVVDATTFIGLVLACAPQVHAQTALALVGVESGFNPWAIGVVGGALDRQPQHRAEALATAKSLRAGGWNFSVGLAQINVGNFARLGLTPELAFEPCTNLAAMQTVLTECFERAAATATPAGSNQATLRRAISCYYSGSFTTGYRHGYVQKVVAAASASSLSSPPVPPVD